MKLFCNHKYKEVGIIKREIYQTRADRCTYLYRCTLCGKEKKKRDD